MKYLLKYILPFLLLFKSVLTFSQKVSLELSSHIEIKLNSIDSLIDNKNFNLALSKIKDLESYSNFISKNENKYHLDLRKAKVLYGLENKEESIDLLLTNLDRIVVKEELLDHKIEYLSFIGDISREAKDYSNSNDYFTECLYTSFTLSDTTNILNSYLNIGRNFESLKNSDSALTYYEKIVQFPINKKTHKFISFGYNNLGIILYKNNDTRQAEEYIDKSLSIKRNQKDTIGLAIGLSNLSGIYFGSEDYDKALFNYQKSYESVKSLSSERAVKLREDLLYNIAYTNEMLGNYESAYKTLERATYLSDSISETQEAEKISEILAKYNFEKQAAETEREKSKRQQAQFLFYGTALAFIAILALGYIFYRNYRLKQQTKLDHLENESQTKIINATIDAKEKERKAIAETLHDSVSALLSSANLHLQATKAQLKKKSPQEITKAQTIVNEASVKIRDLSHELISSVLLKFGLAFAVHDMCQKYSNSELTLHSDDDGIKRYHQDFEIKIHNIIEELVNNILKHSKASNATIMLSHKENDMLSVRISDDGVGFNPRQVRGKDGLGLSHIEARIKVMKGVFNIISSRNNGTNIFILVPIQFKEKSVSA
ncbi:MAG: tetratricopeptide repeat protein [Flavobacteriaceae bacterium]|nr:tetratricopeptide repeat protein [Flavobacteriaceae bacterium]